MNNLSKFYISLILFLINLQTIFSFPNYSMFIENTDILNDSTISFEVYVKSNDSSFELTSYQCALCIDNKIQVKGFSYINASSEFKTTLPIIGLGYNNQEGEIKITFASLPGKELISTKKVRVGKFLIKTAKPEAIPSVQWCFDGKISTILTGSNFDDITNEEDHLNEGIDEIKIVGVSASETDDTNTSPEKTIDGKGANDGDDNSRWAAEPMPAYLIYDLGSERVISMTKFSFYEWNNGRIYHYSISTSSDLSSWNQVIVNDSSSTEEWTVNSINKNARYLKLTFLSNNQSPWAGLWEAKIYGSIDNYVSTNVVEKQKIPAEYSLYQNYPNPFNPNTKINYILKESGQVTMEVYNVLGEKVSTLVNQQMPAGSHEVNFNASNLASGIYIYRLNVENKFIDTKKMILIK